MPDRQPVIAGNWKMNTSLDEAKRLAAAVVSGVKQRPSITAECVLIPPFPWIVPVHDAVSNSGVAVGAQDCATEDAGAFTGAVSAAMLAPLCTYIVVGHSERRHVFGETDATVALKLQAVLRNGAIPILCVGETLDQRDRGSANEVVERQLVSALNEVAPEVVARVVVAYEPVWAIGTGRAASPDDAQNMATQIRSTIHGIADERTAGAVRILYGGSVSPGNACGFVRLADVDGALVGGASLQADSFLAIIDATAGD